MLKSNESTEKNVGNKLPSMASSIIKVIVSLPFAIASLLIIGMSLDGVFKSQGNKEPWIGVAFGALLLYIFGKSAIDGWREIGTNARRTAVKWFGIVITTFGFGAVLLISILNSLMSSLSILNSLISPEPPGKIIWIIIGFFGVVVLLISKKQHRSSGEDVPNVLKDEGDYYFEKGEDAMVSDNIDKVRKKRKVRIELILALSASVIAWCGIMVFMQGKTIQRNGKIVIAKSIAEANELYAKPNTANNEMNIISYVTANCSDTLPDWTLPGSTAGYQQYLDAVDKENDGKFTGDMRSFNLNAMKVEGAYSQAKKVENALWDIPEIKKYYSVSVLDEVRPEPFTEFRDLMRHSIARKYAMATAAMISDAFYMGIFALVLFAISGAILIGRKIKVGKKIPDHIPEA